MLYKNNETVDFLEVNYTTPAGARGCYRFVMDTNQYINTSFFATKTQNELKQILEVVSWSEDAKENFAAINDFFVKAIRNAKNQYWYKWYEMQKAKRTDAVNKTQTQLDYYLKLKNSCALWDRKNIDKKINEFSKMLELDQYILDNLLKDNFMKENSKARKTLERLEKNYNCFLKFMEKLSKGKKARRRAA